MNIILTIYAMSDVYQLESYARVRQYIRPNFYIPHYTLLSGDFLNPLPYTAFDSGRTVIKALNLLPVDIVSFGNHDIEDNPVILNEVLNEDKNTIYVSSNILDIENSIKYHIIENGGIKIGIIGLCDDTFYTKFKINFFNKNIAVRKYIDILKEENVDYIIAMTHNDVDLDYDLIDKFPEIDIILSGHIHSYSYFEYKGTPIIRTGENVETLAEINFYENGKFEVNFNDISNVRQHPSYDKLISEGKELLKSFDNQIIFSLTETYNTDNIRSKPNNLMSKLCQLVKSYFSADIGLINAGLFRLKGKTLDGKFTYSDFNLAFPFDNPFIKIEVNGKTLINAIDYANTKHFNKGGYIHKTDEEIIPNKTYVIALNALMIDGADKNPYFESLKPINVNEGISIRSIFLKFRNLAI